MTEHSLKIEVTISANDDIVDLYVDVIIYMSILSKCQLLDKFTIMRFEPRSRDLKTKVLTTLAREMWHMIEQVANSN